MQEEDATWRAPWSLLAEKAMVQPFRFRDKGELATIGHKAAAIASLLEEYSFSPPAAPGSYG